MERAKRSTCFVDFSLKKSQRKKKFNSRVKGRKKETNFFGKVCKTDTFWSGRNLSPVTLCHVGGRGQKRPESPTQVGRTIGRSENARGGLDVSSYVVGIICLVEIGIGLHSVSEHKKRWGFSSSTGLFLKFPVFSLLRLLSLTRSFLKFFQIFTLVS